MKKWLVMWFWWTAAMAVGWAATAASIHFLPDLNTMLGLALVGTIQWLPVRKHVQGSGLWVLVTYVAGYVGSLVGLLFLQLLGLPSGAEMGYGTYAILWGVDGAVIGLAQAYLFKPVPSNRFAWIPVTAVGYAAAALLRMFVGAWTGIAVMDWRSALVFGAAVGLISGAGLIWILMQGKPRGIGLSTRL